MFRNRDILALLGLLVLVRTAWNSGGESLKAAVDLAFFFSRELTRGGLLDRGFTAQMNESRCHLAQLGMWHSD